MNGVKKIVADQANEIRPTMNNVPIFDFISTEEKDKLAKALTQKTYHPGDKII